MAAPLTHSHYYYYHHHSLPTSQNAFFAAQNHRHRFHVLPRHHRRRLLLPAICASSLNKPRVARSSKKKARSNADVCNDLREFVAEVGLPEGHVPSLKELSQHGRKDLANIVRRRGYKLIRELLAASTGADVTADGEEGNLTGKQDKTSYEEHESTGENENVIQLTEDISLSSGASPLKENSNINNAGNDTCSNVESFFFADGSTELSLREKVAKFIQSGELEAIVDDDLDIVNESAAGSEKGISESQKPAEPEEQSDQVLCTDSGIVVNQSSIGHSTFEIASSRKDASVDQLSSAYSDKEVDVETKTNEDQEEVIRIKFMLHQKELELTHLKEQIEKEKLALSELQAKAETEISKAHKLLLDKDAELQAAEESLSGLMQVEIDYEGDGETVEVAGSFNGWHHGVKMDPQPSSNVTDPVESRKSRLWRTMLWLYPGIYEVQKTEIKFIVDGKWVIDPMREVVTRGTITNNVLRVCR